MSTNNLFNCSYQKLNDEDVYKKVNELAFQFIPSMNKPKKSLILLL